MFEDNSSSESAGNASSLVFDDSLSRAAAQREHAAARARLIMGWRANPDVVANCAVWQRSETTLAELEQNTDYGDLEWGLPDQAYRLFIASQTNVGLADLSEPERTTVRDEHAKTGTRAALDPDSARWVLVEDLNETGPADLPPSDVDAWRAAANAWAARYRARLPLELRHLGMLVLPEPGKPIAVALWVGTERPAATLRSWARAVGGGTDIRDGDGNLTNPGRFRVLRSARTSDSEWIRLEPAKLQATSTAVLRTPARVTGDVTPTGIAALDGLIRLGGTDCGGLTVFVAQDKNCKTLSMLQVAEHRAALGREGVWLARDENEASIQKRRWQYRGDTEAAAKARVARGEVVKDSLAVTSLPMDQVLAVVTELVAKGTALDLYVDSLNGDATGQHEIDELVRRLKATGADVFTTAEGTASRSGPMRVKGSTGVAFAADLTVALKFTKKEDAETLTMRVARSRIANDGQVTVTVNTAGQRFVSATPAAAADFDPLIEAIRNVLTNDGDPVALTQAQIRVRVTGASSAIVEALKAGIVAGAWTLDGRKYRAC